MNTLIPKSSKVDKKTYHNIKGQSWLIFYQLIEQTIRKDLRADGRSCLGSLDGECLWHSGKVVGGGSTVNGMLYVRGDQEDYDAWHRWVGERVRVMEDPLGSWWSDSMV